MKRQLVIIGGGPAGLAAAIEARKNGINDILILERDKQLGGILNQCIHNGFGLHVFKEQLTGPEYADRFIKKAKEMGIEYKLDTMVLSIGKDRTITAVNPKDGLFKVEPKAVILSMGCRERTRGAINIPGDRPSGIFTAGAAQRFINMEGYMTGKNVVILGSGDIGLIMARRMTLEGANVKVVLELMPYSSGLKRNIVQCLNDFNIPLLFNHTIIKMHGRNRLEGITYAEVDDRRHPVPGTEKYVECDTLLLSVGLIPENELSRDAGIELDRVTKGPAVDELMQTSIKGIFACGNVVHVHDLVDFVTQESYLAGYGASAYIKDEVSDKNELICSKPVKGISYVVPQKINPENVRDKVNFFMRCDKVYKNVNLSLKHNGNVIYKQKKSIVTPGEMINVVLNKDILLKINSGDLTFEIEEA